MMKTRWNMTKPRRMMTTLRWMILLQTLGKPAPQVPPNPLLGLRSPPPRKPYRQPKVQSLDRTPSGNRVTQEKQET